VACGQGQRQENQDSQSERGTRAASRFPAACHFLAACHFFSAYRANGTKLLGEGIGQHRDSLPALLTRLTMHPDYPFSKPWARRMPRRKKRDKTSLPLCRHMPDQPVKKSA
jgi:hypothetical protein